MHKQIVTALFLLMALGASGCLLSLTESFEYDVLAETGNAYLDLTGTDDTVEDIDLSNDSTFDDNKDKIRNVDRVGFEAALYPLDGAAAIADVYFRRTAADEWLLLLEGVAVDAGTTADDPTEISYEDSEELIQNFETFQQVAEEGVMQLGLQVRDGAAVASVRVTKLVLIVTITAES